jgi:small subunit ribosomal protein S20
MFKSRLKTMQKQYVAFVEAKSADEAKKSFNELSSLMDSGVSKGILHKNTVARTKSRLHRLLNSIV